MADESMTSRMEAAFGPLLPKRACDDCTVCCTVCGIDELAKPADTRCVHLAVDGGCGIYAQRPGACRDFFCGWRRLPWLTNNLRPDRSGIIITLEVAPAAPNPFERRCIVARWIEGAPADDKAQADRLLALFRRQRVPAFFSAARTQAKRLVHPGKAIYDHIIGGTLPGGAADAEVLRWRQALLG